MDCLGIFYTCIFHSICSFEVYCTAPPSWTCNESRVDESQSLDGEAQANYDLREMKSPFQPWSLGARSDSPQCRVTLHCLLSLMVCAQVLKSFFRMCLKGKSVAQSRAFLECMRAPSSQCKVQFRTSASFVFTFAVLSSALPNHNLSSLQDNSNIARTASLHIPSLPTRVDHRSQLCGCLRHTHLYSSSTSTADAFSPCETVQLNPHHRDRSTRSRLRKRDRPV